MHHSRLGGFIIDCEGADLDAAAAFWGGAFGDRERRRPEGRYVVLDDRGGLAVEVQDVAHPSRVHLDIMSDDIPAETARLERLGARVVERLTNWTVMEAPTGHRFCVIRSKGENFAATANVWEE